MERRERFLYLLVSGTLIMCIVCGFLSQGFSDAMKGFLSIQLHPARLLTDFTLTAGPGAALINSALVGGIGLLLVRMTGIRLSGPTIAAIFTMMGFGLFGKTPLNNLPIFFGVYLSSLIARKRFAEYILIALYGTALGPLTSYVMTEIGLSGITAVTTGMLTGTAIGIFLPPVALSMLRLHQGYNLYNIGLTSGFLGLFVAAIFTAAGKEQAILVLWNTKPSIFLTAYIPFLSAVLIAGGLFLGKRKAVSDWLGILRHSGRLPSDFMELVSIDGSLLNMGILGFCGWLYVFLVGGDFNGPVLGGLLTLIGFSAFGKHLRNVLPVMVGVFIAILVFRKDPTEPGPLLAILFGTTLAPLAGEFGVSVGLIAGFIHLTLVERTAAWHGGVDLYNNGFAGGLTATLMVAVIEWYKSNRISTGKMKKSGLRKKQGDRT